MTMREDRHLIERGIARGAHLSPPITDMAQQGLIEFLKQQIVDAEWKIARAKAEIEAYEAAITAIGPARDGAPTQEVKS